MTTRILSLLVVLPFVASAFADVPGETVYDPVAFGAQADGLALDTAAIQQAIDRCAADGGGTVLLKRGTYLSGTIVLKSNVALRLDKAAILKCGLNPDDFPIMPSKRRSYTGEYVTNRMLIYAEDAENISVLGEGTIDGSGDVLCGLKKPENGKGPSFSRRPRSLHFRNCNNIRVRGVRFINSASWTQSYQSCTDLLVQEVRIFSPNNLPGIDASLKVPHRNADGIDLVDCRRVRIADCDIHSGDDSIVIKSFSTEEHCEDIAITNCRLRSDGSSGIKFGTETVGGFRDVTISNCVIHDTGGDGIAFLSVDGAFLERVTVSNIALNNTRRAGIVVRLGKRDRRHRPEQEPKTGSIKDIIVSNVQGTRVGGHACAVTGIPGRIVENVTLRNINIEFRGSASRRDVVFAEIPENEAGYPNGAVLGPLPAYGLYVRHAKNVVLDNLQFRFEKKDGRPALYCDDVEDLRLSNPFFQGMPDTPGLVRFKNVRNALVSGAAARNETPVFLHVLGEETRGIVLDGHHPAGFASMVETETESLRRHITLR